MRLFLAAGFALGAALASHSALAQSEQANAMMLAQANDRCMTTYAFRMTGTDATDEAIFASATAGCKALKSQLEAQAKPNFLNLLQKIRADRARRAGN